MEDADFMGGGREAAERTEEQVEREAAPGAEGAEKRG